MGIRRSIGFKRCWFMKSGGVEEERESGGGAPFLPAAQLHFPCRSSFPDPRRVPPHFCPSDQVSPGRKLRNRGFVLFDSHICFRVDGFMIMIHVGGILLSVSLLASLFLVSQVFLGPLVVVLTARYVDTYFSTKRDLTGFVETRQRLLSLKPNHRMNWIDFAVAHHLHAKYVLSCDQVAHNNHKDSILKLLLSVMVGTLDLTAFKRDVDELLCEFAQCGSIFFAAFKKVWLSRKFSYIYEGRPTTNSAVFMQGLYAHCIGTYILFKVSVLPFMVLVSINEVYGNNTKAFLINLAYEMLLHLEFLREGELKCLKELVIDAKKDTIDVVVALVKRMLDRCMFLFGSVDSVDGSLNQRVEEAKTLQSKLVQMAYEKLLANSRIEDYLHMDIGAELNIEGFKKMKSEYARAKELAVKEAAETVDIGDIKHIVESRDQVGEKLKVLVESWDDQKEDFRKQIGMVCGNEIVAADDFDEELELLLSED
ncbi:hypothetical protein Taro_009456 [Colocasia esculenta]|uniref:Uncharacterized protein n=1 Tax=Colocasia esculenta TaxID=4460 RepID=A0A843U4U1_COLES|nr:hypothetical protein [Colocasia esculenta]